MTSESRTIAEQESDARLIRVLRQQVLRLEAEKAHAKEKGAI